MSLDRPLEIAAFLQTHEWDSASAEPFEGDFSPRRYARLTDGQRSAVLMDADLDQKTPQFVAIATALRQAGVDAPEIYASDATRGLVLLEDFGTKNVGMLLDKGADPRPLLLQATAVLAQLHERVGRGDSGLQDLPLYTVGLFVSQAELFLDAYFPFALQREADDDEREDFRAAWMTALRPIETMPKSLLLRDFMPDNLMALPGDRLGVLDFQDAGVGPTAYDLASLCDEVRRDGVARYLEDIVNHYCAVSASAPPARDLLRTCALLSAQRHTRILGILANLALRQGRQDKLLYLPRVRARLTTLLNEPHLLPVRVWFSSNEGLLT